MTDEKPLWLLDIDGVINAAVGTDGKIPTHAWPRDVWTDDRAMGQTREWRILAAAPVVELIRSVHEQGRAEIRWHTTWQSQAANVAKVLDLPEFAVEHAPEYDWDEERHRAQWWKLPAVWREVANGRRILWTDDDASYYLTTEQKIRLRQAHVQIVSPSFTEGLCKKHLRIIDEWLPGGANE